MKIDNERYVNIKLICAFYGPAVTCCPQFNSKMLQQKKQDLLNDFGSTLTSSHHVFIDALKFFQTIVYNERGSESLLKTRINMYEKQINKSSLRLIPDRSSHLKRAPLENKYMVAVYAEKHQLW